MSGESAADVLRDLEEMLADVGLRSVTEVARDEETQEGASPSQELDRVTRILLTVVYSRHLVQQNVGGMLGELDLHHEPLQAMVFTPPPGAQAPRTGSDDEMSDDITLIVPRQVDGESIAPRQVDEEVEALRALQSSIMQLREMAGLQSAPLSFEEDPREFLEWTRRGVL